MFPRIACLLSALVLSSVDSEAQFRRGVLAEGTEITLYPHQAPALLLPAGPLELETKNATGAPVRIVGRVRELLARQLLENDARLEVVGKGDGIVLTATLVEWSESRRSSTKYVAEKRQTGTRRTTDKAGNVKFEPVYEYGRTRPSVVVDGVAGLRLEVRRRAGGTPIADETARHRINQEHLVDEGPPSREAVEDELLDVVVKRGAGRVSPGRAPASVRLARSDDVDHLNPLGENRRWTEWLAALDAVKPHRDKKRDAYRLHNLAVANEAIAYESNTPEDWIARLGLASSLIATASAQHPTEKYFTEAATRISANAGAYRQLVEMFASAAAAPMPPVAARRTAEPPRAPAAPEAVVPLANQDVIDLRAAGLDDANLLAAIKDARSVAFDLSPAGLKALLAGKISNRVISAMRARAPN